MKEGWVMMLPYDAKYGTGTVFLEPVGRNSDSPTKDKRRPGAAAENSVRR